MPSYFEECLYFASNQFARHMNTIAEQAFKDIDISATQGFTLLLIEEKDIHSPGILAKELDMKPSTITRFLDKLEKNGYIERNYKGRSSTVDITDLGKDKIKSIHENWEKIYETYCKTLGKDFAEKLTEDISKANSMYNLD